eukprot:366057-Chlamydomonas_euryale.AAC.10
MRPPLLLHNLLPVSGRYTIWQRPTHGLNIGNLRMRGSGVVPPGGTAHVYCADVRYAVHLTFEPEGAHYVDGEPLLLCYGQLGGAKPGVSSEPSTSRSSSASTSCPLGEIPRVQRLGAESHARAPPSLAFSTSPRVRKTVLQHTLKDLPNLAFSIPPRISQTWPSAPPPGSAKLSFSIPPRISQTWPSATPPPRVPKPGLQQILQGP